MTQHSSISIPVTATSETSAARSELLSNTASSNIDINIRTKTQSDVVTIPTRVKYAQLGVYIFMIIGIIFSQLNYADDSADPTQKYNPFLLSGLVSALIITWICIFLILYKNTSVTIIYKLLKEPNVWQVIVLSSCLLLIDIFSIGSVSMIVRSVAYVVGLATLVLLDAVEKKSRNFILAAGTVYSLLTLYHVLIRIFSMEEENKILMVIYGKSIYIRSMKRSIFSNSFILMLKGLKTLYKDKRQEFLMFCTRHVLLKDEVQSLEEDNDKNEESAFAFRNMKLHEKIGHVVLLLLSVGFIVR